MTNRDTNLDTFSRPDAVEQYSKATELTACELYLFSKYISRSKAILDLGVGGGRTTPYLAAQASLYVGLDYSAVMVDICRKKFPSLRFVCDDASNLQRFTANSFDVVVFSFNGIDYIRTDRDRTRCFREVARVLRAGGCFIFSSHNARSVGLRANLRKYLFDRRVTEPGQASKNIKSADGIDFAFRLRSLAAEMGPWRLVRKLLRAIRISVGISLRRLHLPKIYRGTGYIFDYAHGGLTGFVSTPEYILAESRNSGFEILEVVSNSYPTGAPDHSIQWYYYVLRVGAE
jgi:SAM-dependent methyltransferase